MQDDKQQKNRAQTRSRAARKTKAINLGELIGRLAFSVPEFSALFGHSGTRGYRAVYRGLVKPITEGGRLLIPRTEVDRLLARTAEYNPSNTERDGKGDQQ